MWVQGHSDTLRWAAGDEFYIPRWLLTNLPLTAEVGVSPPHSVSRHVPSDLYLFSFTFYILLNFINLTIFKFQRTTQKLRSSSSKTVLLLSNFKIHQSFHIDHSCYLISFHVANPYQSLPFTTIIKQQPLIHSSELPLLDDGHHELTAVMFRSSSKCIVDCLFPCQAACRIL